MRLLGVHLLQSVDLVGSPRRSAVAELDASGALTDLRFASAVDDLADALGAPPARVAVDAPMAIANDTGRRGVEEVLAWCDIPAFPVSRRRLDRVFGGRRGEELRAAAPSGLELVETLPDVALRTILWEEETRGEPMELAAYRARWLGVRPPAYRPKAGGRARPEGIAAAQAALARHVDLGGWRPAERPDDWAAISDAAAVDAIACAYAAWRWDAGGGAVRLEWPPDGAMVLPADANLRARLELTVGRLRGDVSIAPQPPGTTR